MKNIKCRIEFIRRLGGWINYSRNENDELVIEVDWNPLAEECSGNLKVKFACNDKDSPKKSISLRAEKEGMGFTIWLSIKRL